MFTISVTITGRFICCVNSYCDNNDNNGRSICSVYSYFDNNDNNGEVYVQCLQLL